MTKSKQLKTAASLLCLAVVLAPAALVIRETSAQESEMSQQEQIAQRARGAQAWAETCGRCHNIRPANEFTDDIWDVSVNHMRIRGNIPPSKIRDIKAFLKSSN